jgi:pimeloyl-ACP methyl ester carboxylesterase
LSFTPFHRGGSGPPLVCLHGFADTWRTWELVLPALERQHDVLAPTLAGHAGGPAIRAQTVVALAPAGGWAAGDESYKDLLSFQLSMHELARTAAPHAEAIVSSPEGRRRATQHITTNFEHIPAELVAHQMLGVASCEAAPALIDHATREGWSLQAEKITCPVRIVWGTDDGLLPWPSAAARYCADSLPHADWVELEGVGHAPQLDVPLETAQLILGFTST